MDEDERIIYLYSLDLRIIEAEEKLEHIRKLGGKPLVEVARKKLLWDEIPCPLCWLVGNYSHMKKDLECKACPAGTEGDNYCREYISYDYDLALGDYNEAEQEMVLIDMIQSLKDQRQKIEEELE